MKQIRLAWAQAITVVAGSAAVQSTDWESDTPEARRRLESQASAANASDGPDTYWIEESTTESGPEASVPSRSSDQIATKPAYKIGFTGLNTGF